MIPQRLWHCWQTLMITWTPRSSSVRSAGVAPVVSAWAGRGRKKSPVPTAVASTTLVWRKRRRSIPVTFPFVSAVRGRSSIDIELLRSRSRLAVAGRAGRRVAVLPDLHPGMLNHVHLRVAGDAVGVRHADLPVVVGEERNHRGVGLLVRRAQGGALHYVGVAAETRAVEPGRRRIVDCREVDAVRSRRASLAVSGADGAAGHDGDGGQREDVRDPREHRRWRYHPCPPSFRTRANRTGAHNVARAMPTTADDSGRWVVCVTQRASGRFTSVAICRALRR